MRDRKKKCAIFVQLRSLLMASITKAKRNIFPLTSRVQLLPLDLLARVNSEFECYICDSGRYTYTYSPLINWNQIYVYRGDASGHTPYEYTRKMVAVDLVGHPEVMINFYAFLDLNELRFSREYVTRMNVAQI